MLTTNEPTAIQQNISRLEKRMNEIMENYSPNPFRIPMSQVDSQELAFLNAELTENKKLLEVEKEQLIEAHRNGMENRSTGRPGLYSEIWFTNTYEQ